MRNLRITDAVIATFDQNEEFRDCEKLIDDFSTGAVFVATRKALIFLDEKLQRIASLNWSDERGSTNLVDLHFMAENDELYAVFENGIVLTISVASKELINDAALLGCEVRAAGWSPDNENLVVVGDDLVYYFDRMLTLVAESPLIGESRGKDELVTVGWGSRETQFQGSVGKDARNKREVNRKAYADDSGEIYVSWRGDAQYVAISYLDCLNEERRVAIFNRDGELMSRLQNDFSLEAGVAMRPFGNYIATTRRHENGSRSMCFFERNGEFRHEARLFGENGIRKRFQWDSEASVLAFEMKCDEMTYLELWVVSNYDWAMKLRISFHEDIKAWHWSSTQARRLWILEETGLRRIDFSLDYDVVDGVVIAIATDSLRVTDLARAPVPPPLCNYSLKLRSPIQLLIHQEKGLAVVYDDFTIQYWKNTVDGFQSCALVTPKFDVTMPKTATAGTFCGDSIVLAFNEPGGSLISYIDKDGTIERTSRVEHCVTGLRQSGDNNLIAILATGELVNVNEKRTVYKQSLPISRFEFYQDHLLVLASNRLFVDNREIAKDVFSFLVRQSMILYISLSSKLCILDANNAYRPFTEERAVEAGSLLVGCAREPGTSVVMQMPRGNLEMIHPRRFVVQLIKTQINARQYADALRFMKKHRIDMNLLVDNDPETFLKNISLIIRSVRDADLLNLFLASLNDAPSEWIEKKECIPRKVETICSAFVESFLNLPIETRLEMFTVLLSALLRTTPPQIHEALKFLREHSLEVPTETREKTTRRWLHHIGFFVESKMLFSAALATYDLLLATQVAEATNADPKEFLPLLNRLRKIEPTEYRRYHIDLSREDWRSALSNIAQLDEKFDEALELIRQRELYPDALIIYQKLPRYKDICAWYASFLEAKVNWMDAALLYAKAHKFEDQLRCLEKTREPLEYYEVAQKVGRSNEEITINLRKMSAALKSSNNWEKLAIALSLISSPISEICDVYCQAGHWDKAIDKAGDEEKASSHVHTSIVDKAERLLSTANAKSQELNRFVERLKTVRKTKETRIGNLKDGIEDGRDLENIDAYSEASTMSGMSKRTGSSRASTTATARKRKAIEKKKRNLKEGGEWEDAAILLAAHEIYTTLDDVIRDTANILRPLVRLGEISLGASLQLAISRFETQCQQLYCVFWPHRLAPCNLLGPLHHIYTIDHVFSPPDANGMPSSFVLEPELLPPKMSTIAWKLSILEGTP
ncbi:unnamed protein product, partial [Mesorhabditis belari]|uniref:Elongator complex protein 1 n=1 Tax=Mesorhabditis belari TaxID=2138241 RepID=A0AAF3F468_9BILA